MFASNLGGSEGPGGSTWLFIDLSNCEFALQLVTHSVCFTNFVVGKQVKKSLWQSVLLHMCMNNTSVYAGRVLWLNPPKDVTLAAEPPWGTAVLSIAFSVRRWTSAGNSRRLLTVQFNRRGKAAGIQHHSTRKLIECLYFSKSVLRMGITLHHYMILHIAKTR